MHQVHPAFTSPRYESAVVSLKPVRYFRLNESNGTRFADRMAVADARLVGSAAQVAATQLGAAGAPGVPDSFGLRTTSGSSAWALAGTSAMPTTAYTLACWTFIRSQVSPDTGIFGKWSNGVGGLLYKPNSTKISFIHRGTNINSTSNPALNRWHFVVGTWSGTQTRLYINGVLDGGPSNNSTAPGDVGEWSICTYNVVGFYDSRRLSGTVSEAAYWDRELSPAEINYLAALGSGR